MTKEQRSFKRKVIQAFKKQENRYEAKLILKILAENDDILIYLFRLSKGNLDRTLIFLQLLDISLTTCQIDIPFNLRDQDNKVIRAIDIISVSINKNHNNIIDFHGKSNIPNGKHCPNENLIEDLNKNLSHLKSILLGMKRPNLTFSGRGVGPENNTKWKLLRDILYKSQRCFGKPSNQLALAISKSKNVCKVFGDDYRNAKTIKRIKDSL